MRLLGVLKSKLKKILKLSFSTSPPINEAPAGTQIVFNVDTLDTISGGTFNPNGSSTSSINIYQQPGSDFFNLQRDFDLTFDLMLNVASPGGEFITIEDSSESSWFRLDYSGTGAGFSMIHGGRPNFTSANSGAYIPPKGVWLACKIEYRRTSVKFIVDGVTVINATGWLTRTNTVRSLWLGGSGASNTIVGSMDNVEMVLYT